MQSSVDGHWCCFYFLTVMNNVAVSTHAHAFVWTYVLISLAYIPKRNCRIVW